MDASGDIVDLTEDIPVNPLAEPVEQVSPQRPKRRRAAAPNTNTSINVIDDESDIEITDVVERSPVIFVDEHKKKKIKRKAVNDRSIKIVKESTLTPQDKLERIRQQHLRGQPVNLDTASGRRNGMGFNTQSPRFAEHGFPLPVPGLPGLRNPPSGPASSRFSPAVFNRMMESVINLSGGNRRILDALLGPASAPAHENFFDEFMSQGEDRSRDGPLAPFTGSDRSPEDAAFERALQASTDPANFGPRVNVSDIKLPRDPLPVTKGFTRAVTGKESLVCIKCDNELGIARPDLPNSGRVFFRGCGHVYCGQCTFDLQNRRNNKKCPDPKCVSCSSKKKNLFRELYI